MRAFERTCCRQRHSRVRSQLASRTYVRPNQEFLGGPQFTDNSRFVQLTRSESTESKSSRRPTFQRYRDKFPVEIPFDLPWNPGWRIFTASCNVAPRFAQLTFLQCEFAWPRMRESPMRIRRVLLIAGLLLFCAGRAYAVATITVNGVAAPNTVTVGTGNTVAVAVSGGPGNATDWIAMYASGAPNGAFLDWFYLNGSKTAPATGVTSATVNFVMSSTAGNYEFRFFANNGYTLLATSGTVIAILPPSITSVTASSGHVGDEVSIVGTRFGSTQGSSTLKFNGTTASPTLWSDTNIVTPVPVGATTGSVIATVSGAYSNGVMFTLLAPSLAAVTPSSGQSGDMVTLAGRH